MRQIAASTLGQLYRQHSAALLLYARQFCSFAEDVVQDAFVKLATTAPPPEQAVPWLYSVVRNEALAGNRSWLRRRRREGRAGASELWFAQVDEALDAKAATQALAHLPLELREVIVSRLWSGLKFEEIAAIVGSSTATVHRRYRDGLAQLRERLEGKCTNPIRSTTD